MAKTKDGVLYLSKTEQEALEFVKSQIVWQANYSDYPLNSTDAKKAQRGVDLINFILQITK